jgi:hypothetical protein
MTATIKIGAGSAPARPWGVAIDASGSAYCWLDGTETHTTEEFAMTWTRDAIEQFLRAYLDAGNALDLEAIAKAYHDPFMFAAPGGVRVIPVQPFLSALPARRAFFDSVGQRGTQLVSFTDTILDDRYVLVEAKLRMRFEREAREPIEVLVGSTFVLFDDGETRRIVFHLESEGIEQVLRDRGILRDGS